MEYYFELPNEIFEWGLSENELIIYAYLACLKQSNGSTKASYSQIGNYTGVSSMTVQRTMKKLQEKNLIKVVNNCISEQDYENRYVGFKTANEYKLYLPTGKEFDIMEGAAYEDR